MFPMEFKYTRFLGPVITDFLAIGGSRNKTYSNTTFYVDMARRVTRE